MQPGSVICLGAVVVDVVFTVDEIPRQPVKIGARGKQIRCGGPAATAAVACSVMGTPAQLWSRIGRDGEGAIIRAALAKHGVDTDALIETDADTVVAMVVVDRHGERLIVAHGGTDLPRSTAPLALDRVAAAGAVLADVSWLEGAVALFEAARTANVPSILDGEEYDTANLLRLARRATLPVFSEGAARFLSGGAAPSRDSLAALADQLAGDFGITLGTQGSLWWIGGEIVGIPALDIVSRDTTGAGDVFHGALALAAAERMPLAQAARFATACAGLKVEAGNGWDGMPTRGEVERAMGRL